MIHGPKVKSPRVQHFISYRTATLIDIRGAQVAKFGHVSGAVAIRSKCRFGCLSRKFDVRSNVILSAIILFFHSCPPFGVF